MNDTAAAIADPAAAAFPDELHEVLDDYLAGGAKPTD